MSDAIVYPVRAVNDSVADAEGLRISDAAWIDRGDGETYAIARRISAALNATRHLTVEQLETGDVQFSGSRLAECGEVSIGCISREARDLLDDIMDAYKAHYPRLCETCPKDSDVFGAPVSPDDAYGFAYWLVRWSGLVRPANSGSAAQGE